MSKQITITKSALHALIAERVAERLSASVGDATPAKPAKKAGGKKKAAKKAPSQFFTDVIARKAQEGTKDENRELAALARERYDANPVGRVWKALKAGERDTVKITKLAAKDEAELGLKPPSQQKSAPKKARKAAKRVAKRAAAKKAGTTTVKAFADLSDEEKAARRSEAGKKAAATRGFKKAAALVGLTEEQVAQALALRTA